MTSVITLKRVRQTDDSTIGTLTVGTNVYATLEDIHREVKIPEETRIPAGTYYVTLRNEGGKTLKYADRYGDMHKGMLWLRDVPDFNWIYIHTGNVAAHTEGCILIGMRAGQNKILSSREAYQKVYPVIVEMIENDECQIVVKDEGG